MTKARDIADFKFENITDTGTEGTRVALGTTAQRGSTQGQLRFNTTTGLAEYYNGSVFKSIDSPPTVSSLDTTLVDSNAGGNQTIVITGSGFNTGATVTFIGSSANFNASTVTVDSDTQITAVAPKSSFLNAQEPYGVKVVNLSGLSATLANQISVDTSVAWSTSAGSLGSVLDNATGTHFTVSATDADSDTITYSVQSGSLPAGMSLNSSTGAISGDPTDVTSATTSNFTLRASTTHANADRAFSITVNPAPINIDYLVIAGGGSGGGSHRAGGGGAGGYRNSYNSETSGRNSSSETALSVTSGTTLTITVGAGGSMPSGGAQGVAGNASSIAGSGITTITSNGGGGGGTYESDAPSGTFGSGAGAGQDTNENQVGSDGTAGQGFDGGDTQQGNNLQQGGCGGGASENGAGGGTTSNASGGNGLSSSITGSAVTRAGGGGGGAYGQGGKGFGGSGGGAQGGWKDSSHGSGVVSPLSSSYYFPQSGTANTGGGGGGMSGSQSSGTSYGSGGSGVVILRVPTAQYSGTTSGSPTVSTVGSDKVLIFNGDGSYTA
tara:strand:+ start:238 stop:1896 length:1659 start_codon:yes stop_codon:yes gene_type:complete